MNLKEVYEIFYPRKGANFSVWEKPQKYRSKQEFFDALIPTELRCLNVKLWNDKSRRSHFLSGNSKESRYLSLVKDVILQNDLMISRVESRGQQILGENICEEAMNEVFFRLIEKEKIECSDRLKTYLIEEESGRLKQEWGNVLTFLTLYVMFPLEVNQLYGPYLTKREEKVFEPEGRQKLKDESLYKSEYPPDMSVYKPGDEVAHTWLIKNAGEMVWEDRYLECTDAPVWLEEDAVRIRLPKMVYPGDIISPSVCFSAPDKPGAYVLNWKMKDRRGGLTFLSKMGVGLHFMVLEEQDIKAEKNNYKILEETPEIPVTLPAGSVYTHVWTIQNTESETWEDYYCECINGECFYYTKKEMQIPLKSRVRPGETVCVTAEFVTAPTEGVYRLIWRIMKGDGTPAFPDGRRLEIFLNLTRQDIAKT